MFDNHEDTLLVGFCGVHDKDHPVLVVGRKRPNQTVEIINAFEGSEAEELYKKLVTLVKKEK